MGVAVVEQWKAELAHCEAFGDAIGVERARDALRGLDVDPDGGPKAAPKRAAKKAAPKAE